MSIVHVHIERTGGVSMQELYENKFGGDDMLWYIPRPGDHMFAPFGIETTTHLDDTELQRLADAAKYNPDLKNEWWQEELNCEESKQ